MHRFVLLARLPQNTDGSTGQRILLNTDTGLIFGETNTPGRVHLRRPDDIGSELIAGDFDELHRMLVDE